MAPLDQLRCGNVSTFADTPAGWMLTALAAIPFCLLLLHLTRKPPSNPHTPDRSDTAFVRPGTCALATVPILLIASTPVLAQTALITEACKLYDRLDILASWVRNFFILVSALILIFIFVQSFSGRINWKHLAVLGGSVAILALAHLLPQWFFTADCAHPGVTIID